MSSWLAFFFFSSVGRIFFCTFSSFIGLYILHNDYKVAQESVSHQMKGLHTSLDRRISDLEKLKQANVSDHAEAVE
ncbi:hypothetical protein ACJRO7_020844 [Eucalyptus globulus]|uniref:Uncharacterized protein n=1 Tax=Eucalyptus globulus TaxID=34317 RepID=A0ABD3KMT0_EUCGL